MNELIKINYNNDRTTTSARALWEFLEKPYTKFTMWFDKYKEYGFVENEDFREVSAKTYTSNGAVHNAKDYEITIDMAKELAMLQKTEKGKEARKYFLKLEKKWNSPEFVMARAIKMANSRILTLEESMAKKDQIIGELKPKADYMDTILKNKGLVTIGQIAKDYGMSATKMNSLLHDLKVQYKQSKQWLLYSRYHDKGYTHSETINIVRSDGRPDIKMNTKWTQKGRVFIYGLLKGIGVLPMIEQSIAV